MTKTMKKAYRLFKRKDRDNYYIQNNATREQRIGKIIEAVTEFCRNSIKAKR